MALRTLTLFFWGCLIATAAVAGEQHKMKTEVAVDGDGEDHRVFEWRGDGTTIDDLDVGESKTIIANDEIDDETRARLEDVLKEAGKDGEIMFIDGSEPGGDEQAGTRR